MHPSSQNQHNNIKKSPAGTPYIIVVATISIFLSLQIQPMSMDGWMEYSISQQDFSGKFKHF